MNVASLELCRELYELSGWEDTDLFHNWGKRFGTRDVYKRGIPRAVTDFSKVVDFAEVGRTRLQGLRTQYVEDGYVLDDYREKLSCPAYDLGYLLRKLPDFYLNRDPDGFYSIELDSLEGSHYRQDADTPENAVCKLCIELFKQGILANT